MSGFKQVIILFIVFSLKIDVLTAFKNLENIIDEWEVCYNSSGKETIVDSNGTLLRIVKDRSLESIKAEDYYVHIDTIYPKNKNISCKFPWLGSKHIHVDSLGNGKILIWSTLNLSTHLISIVNPVDCTHTAFYCDKKIHAIFTYDNTFDIINDNDRRLNGAVYRYNEKGNLIKTFDNILLYSTFVSRKFDMFEKYNPNNYYFVLRQISDSKTGIDILDKNFIYAKTFTFYHPIDSYSAVHGNFSLCYEKNNFDNDVNKILKCQLLDWNFDVKANVLGIKHNSYINSIEMHNLLGGGAIIVYSIMDFQKLCTHVYYRHIDANGRMEIQDILVGTISSFNVELYLHELSAIKKTYCILLIHFKKVTGKCIDV